MLSIKKILKIKLAIKGYKILSEYNFFFISVFKPQRLVEKKNENYKRKITFL